MSKKTDVSGRLNQVVSLSLAAVVSGAAPGAALASPPAPRPGEVSARPEAAQDRLHARIEAAIRQLRAAEPALGQGEAAPLHLAQWRNR